MAASEELNPAWVRKCADMFKKDKCKLASEERTLENWRRFNRRMEVSPYKTAIKLICPGCDLATSRKSKRAGGKGLKCTCSQELAARLPVLAVMQDVPKELLGDEEKPVGGGAPTRKSKTQVRVKKEPTGDDTYYAFMGDEGLDPMKFNQEDLKREEKEEGQEPEREPARAGGGSDAEEGEDDGEDLEDADYGAGERYDDDDDLVDEEGGGSDDEAERYGTF